MSISPGQSDWRGGALNGEQGSLTLSGPGATELQWVSDLFNCR